jgi:Flp pilus assembly protein TadG
MTRIHPALLRRFVREEAGSAVVPFALWLPVFLALILSTIELGTVTVRSTALERALDQTVRDVRLGSVTSHAAIRQSVCDRASVLQNCDEMLEVEMVRLDMRNWSAPPAAAQCVDTSDAVTPNIVFDPASPSQMMFLRACYKYRPITPAGTLSSSLAQDAQGYTAVVAASAFVTEPS